MSRQSRHYRKSVFRRSARGSRTPGAKPQGARRRLVLHLERLEDRFLMNGDPAPLAAVSLAADVDVASQLVVADDIGPGNWLSSYWNATAPPVEDSSSHIANLPGWLVAEADRRHGDLFGESISTPRFNYWNWQRLGLANIDVDVPVLFANSTVADTDFSTTNTQVAGVDEADLVETDGEFLYVISHNELLILDARESGKLTLASRIQLDARPTGMYLAGDRLTLITTGIGWNSYYNRTPSTTEVKSLDVSDRSTPKLVQSTEIDGRLVSSRMVDGELRIVLQQDSRHWSNLLPNLQRYFVDFDEATQTQNYRYETRNEYLGRVHKLLGNYSMPSYRTLSVDGDVLGEQTLVTWEELAEPMVTRHASATTIATFETLGDTAGPTATKTLFTQSAAEIYATEDSLYVFGRSVNSSYNETTIWKYDFDATDHSIKLSATGSVDGYLLNQFSIDEYDGFLRVVTTGQSWRSGQSLFVLQQAGKRLKTVGKVENLAPGEQLHSVRFTGNQAFVVTFRRVDPLFAIDLSDPTNPVVAGELKIPGFSDYLQPLGENHLLGIGRGANESSGLIQELQVSIFDVSDLNDPLLAHRHSFGGGRNTASIALGEHHAVSYFPSAEILAIPVYSNPQWSNFRWNINNTATLGVQESALQVFQVDVQTGFEPIATIKHNSRIVRSLRIGEQLVVVSTDQITVHDLKDPSQTLAKMDLHIGSDEGLVELAAYLSPQTLAAIQVLTTTSAEGIADRITPDLLTEIAFSLESNALAQQAKPVTNSLLAIDASLATLGKTAIVESASEIDSRNDPYASLNPEFQQALSEIFAASSF